VAPGTPRIGGKGSGRYSGKGRRLRERTARGDGAIDAGIGTIDGGRDVEHLPPVTRTYEYGTSPGGYPSFVRT
jgi:hypothetical protein